MMSLRKMRVDGDALGVDVEGVGDLREANEVDTMHMSL